MVILNFTPSSTNFWKYCNNGIYVSEIASYSQDSSK